MFPTKRVLPLVLAVLFGGCAAGGGEGEEAASEAPADPDLQPVVILETSLGRIVMQLDREKAPKTVANFITHVNLGFYNGLMFHRVMPDFMIQTGLLTANLERRGSPAAFLENEGDNGLKNVLGAVGMARGKDPHSAKTEIFINVKDNPRLDSTEDEWGYAVFGRVVEGMDVVEQIRTLKTDQRGRFENVPVEPAVIDTAYVATDYVVKDETVTSSGQ